MLALLAAAAIAAAPVAEAPAVIPTDFDLAEVVTDPIHPELIEIGPNLYSTDPETVDPETLTPEQIDGFFRGVQERRIAYHVLNAADLATTLYCVNHIDGCNEQNPIYGNSQLAIVGGKVASAVIYELVLNYLLDHSTMHSVRVYQFSQIAIMGGVVAWNTHVVF